MKSKPERLREHAVLHPIGVYYTRELHEIADGVMRNLFHWNAAVFAGTIARADMALEYLDGPLVSPESFMRTKEKS